MTQPTAADQYMLEMINQARANPSAAASNLGISLNQGLSSGTISTAAKQPLAFNQDLIDSAHKHSSWMLATDTFSHTGAGGSDPGARIKAEGYKPTGWGENISITWGGNKTASQSVVEGMENGLFKSAGHRTNILKDNLKEIGVGVEAGEYKGSAGVTATQNFGKAGSASFLTGVAFDDKDKDNFYDIGEGLSGIHVQAKSATGQVFDADGWSTGGWQIAVPQGSYTLTFTGGGLAAPVVKTAQVGASNVKVDLNQDVGTVTKPPTVDPKPVPEMPAPKPVPETKPAPDPVPEKPVPAPSVNVEVGTWRNDKIIGTKGDDHASGRGGNDKIFGAAGNDKLMGEAGNDWLFGDAGNDVLIGGKGADWLAGGSGADSFVFTSLADRGDRIVDFKAADGDKIDVSALLDAYGYKGTDPLADGTLTFKDIGLGERVDVHVGGKDVSGLVTLVGVHDQDVSASAFVV